MKKSIKAVAALTLLLPIIAQSAQFTYKLKFQNGTSKTRSIKCKGFTQNSRDCKAKKNEAKQEMIAEYQNDAIRKVARQVGDDFKEAGQQIKKDAAAAGRAVANGASAAAGAVDRGVKKTVDALTPKTFPIKLGDHTMKFTCHGNYDRANKEFTTQECQDEYKEVVAVMRAAIKAGKTPPETLAEHRIQSDPVARTVVGAAVATSNAIKNGVNHSSHVSCSNKVARHARDFDKSYASSSQKGLVSYVDKMEYVKDKLVEEERFKSCEKHFESAVLGYQLKWVAGGKLAQEDTHIFDGLGRVASGKAGFWKSESRSNAGQVYRSLSQEAN